MAESNKNEIPTQLNATRETQMKKTLTRIDKFRYFFSTCTLVVYICITIGIEPGFNVYSVYNDKLLYRTHKTISSRRSEYNISYSPTDEEEIMGKKKKPTNSDDYYKYNKLPAEIFRRIFYSSETALNNKK